MSYLQYKKLNLWIEVKVTRVNVTESLVIHATGLWFGNLQIRDKLCYFGCFLVFNLQPAE